MTSFNMQPHDELVLDALRAEYGTEHIGEAIRRALRDAASMHGLDVDDLDPEVSAAA